MGGCASRPKVLREEYDAPLPLPLPPAVEEAADKQEEVTKDVVVVEEANAAVDAVNHTDLLSIQDEQQSSEEVKEEIFETKEASEGSKSKPREHQSPREEQTQALIVDSPAEAASMPEASEPVTCVEKTIEEVKEVTQVPCMDEQKHETKTGEDDTPKQTEEGLNFALDHYPKPENNTEEGLDIAEDTTSEPETPLEDKIEEKQIIADEKPQQMKTEEEVEAPVTSTTTEESKKPSDSKKQYWPIAALLRNPLGNFAKAK